MIILIVILSYIASIFLNRWFNKILYEKFGDEKAIWFWFFPPFLSTLILGLALSSYFLENIFKRIKIKIPKKFVNWFLGKHWK